jgi:carbon-monoxide dehydrogenase medium subunit
MDWINARTLDDDAITEIAHRVSDELDPADDVHASAAYRKRAAGALTRRVLRQAAARAAAGRNA